MTKAEFLSIASNYYEELEALKELPNFYDYEKNLVDIWQKFGNEFIENHLNDGSFTEDRRKKKLLRSLEKSLS